MTCKSQVTCMTATIWDIIRNSELPAFIADNIFGGSLYYFYHACSPKPSINQTKSYRGSHMSIFQNSIASTRQQWHTEISYNRCVSRFVRISVNYFRAITRLPSLPLPSLHRPPAPNLVLFARYETTHCGGGQRNAPTMYVIHNQDVSRPQIILASISPRPPVIKSCSIKLVNVVMPEHVIGLSFYVQR